MFCSRFALRAAAAPLLALLVVAGCESPRNARPAQGPQRPATDNIVVPPPGTPGSPGFTPGVSALPPGPLPIRPAEVALPSEQRARVALLLPLSGNNAEVGRSLLNAAQLALFDFADQRFDLVVEDTGGTPEGATEAARKAVNQGVALILGPLLSAPTKAVAAVARDAGINVISFSSDRTAAQPGVYIMGFTPESEVARVVDYARTRGILRIAALAPDTPYGVAVTEALRQSATRTGSLIVQTRLYPPATVDFSSVVRDLARFEMRKAALDAQKEELRRRDDEMSRRALERLERRDTIGDLPFDGLLLGDGGPRLQALAAQLPAYDIDPSRVRMLGTGQWDVPNLGAEPALFGAWYSAPDPKDRDGFVQRYREVYGRAPERIATLAYDAVALAAVLAQSSGGADFRTAAITAPEGFQGRDGIFRFLPDGVNQRGLAVLEVQRRDARVIDQAPQAFRDLGS
jgi:branched-chain amino acid transport system substrate-binding protein